MPNPFFNAVTAALATVRNATGVEVTYHRGASQVTIEKATKGQSRFESDNGFGLTTEMRTADWLIEAAAIDFGDGPVEPDEGDLVKQTIGSDVIVFEVMAPGGAEPAWRYADPQRTTVRIHSKQVATE